MSRGLLDFMDRFTLEEASRGAGDEKSQAARRAAAGSRY
jgi:hypothetical protein